MNHVRTLEKNRFLKDDLDRFNPAPMSEDNERKVQMLDAATNV